MSLVSWQRQDAVHMDFFSATAKYQCKTQIHICSGNALVHEPCMMQMFHYEKPFDHCTMVQFVLHPTLSKVPDYDICCVQAKAHNSAQKTFAHPLGKYLDATVTPLNTMFKNHVSIYIYWSNIITINLMPLMFFYSCDDLGCCLHLSWHTKSRTHVLVRVAM